MRLRYLLPIATFCCAISANALDINTQDAGTLSSLIGDDTAVTTLKITGPVNATDLDYINLNLKDLTTLDLSDATIVAQSEVKAITGGTEFAADELPAYSLFGSGITTIALPENLVSIGESALAKSAVTSVTIPATVTTIGKYAFTGCDNLKDITIPSTVTQIGTGAWKDCLSLENVTIYSRIESIADNMFDGCVKLGSVSLQPTVTSIGNSSFANCAALTSFSFPTSLVSIGDKAFYGSGLTSVQLAGCKSLASIGDFCFAKCTSLTQVAMGSQSVALGQGIFFDDTALRTVELPASTTTIPAFTFKGTKAINAENALPATTTKIEDYALCGWENVDSFILPSGTSYLGTGAMEGWTSLKKLSAESLTSVPTLGDEVWAGVDQPEVLLYVKDTDTENAFKAADQWNNFHILVGTTGVDNILDDVTGNNGAALVDFNVGDGYLNIRSQGGNIARVNIFDLNGRSRYTASVDVNNLSVNTSQWRGSVLIVDVTLEDNSRATIKLSI